MENRATLKDWEDFLKDKDFEIEHVVCDRWKGRYILVSKDKNGNLKEKYNLYTQYNHHNMTSLIDFTEDINKEAISNVFDAITNSKYLAVNLETGDVIISKYSRLWIDGSGYYCGYEKITQEKYDEISKTEDFFFQERCKKGYILVACIQSILPASARWQEIKKMTSKQLIVKCANCETKYNFLDYSKCPACWCWETKQADEKEKKGKKTNKTSNFI